MQSFNSNYCQFNSNGGGGGGGQKGITSRLANEIEQKSNLLIILYFRF